jgi:hypothetical protein
LPDNSPASYRYENESGERFLVLAFDSYPFTNDYSRNYYNSYYRQAQLIDAVEWACGKKLPAVTRKSPCVYIIAATGEDGSLALAVANVFLDEVEKLEIELAGEYSSVSCDGAKAELRGDRVVLDCLNPYGFALVELKK